MSNTAPRLDDDPFAELDNESRTCIALHDAMMKLYFDKEHKKCVELAEKLLSKAAVPDLIRARAHMIMSLKKKSAFSVSHAEQAIALINGLRGQFADEPFPQDQLDEAERCVQAAKH